MLDASVVVELLTNGSLARSIQAALTSQNEAVIVPHILDIEVLSALRNLAASRRLDPHSTAQMVAELGTLGVERYAHTALLPRIWELRHNFTSYDATYIALAEETNSVLFTSDQKLSKGHRARVKVFAEQ